MSENIEHNIEEQKKFWRSEMDRLKKEIEATKPERDEWMNKMRQWLNAYRRHQYNP